MKHKVLHFDAQRLGEKAATTNKLVPCGTFHREDFPGGKIVVDRKYLETMVANWQALGSPRLPIDYFHRGDSSNDGLATEMKVAAGWISALEVRDDGLYAETSWTPKARAHIDAEELQYFSPTWAPNYTDPKSGKRIGPTLLGGALLNAPFFKELPALAAADGPARKETHMLTLANLAALLLLSADTATEETITTRIKSLVDGEKKAGELKATAASDALNLKASEAERTKLEARVTSMEAERQAEKVAGLFERIFATGRKVEKEQVVELAAAVGLEKAEKMLMRFPVAVDLKERGVRGNDTPPEHDALLATYNTKLDELIKGGKKFFEADRELKKDPQFAPLFNLKSIAAPAA